MALLSLTSAIVLLLVLQKFLIEYVIAAVPLVMPRSTFAELSLCLGRLSLVVDMSCCWRRCRRCCASSSRVIRTALLNLIRRACVRVLSRISS